MGAGACESARGELAFLDDKALFTFGSQQRIEELIDAVALVGPKERIAERVEAWKASPVDTMLIGAGQPEALRLLAELLL